MSYHVFNLIDSRAPGGHILVPQKMYVGNNAPFNRKTAVIFPGGINLRYASEQRLASRPEYQARPTTSNPDRLKFTLRIEWPGYRGWECNITARERRDPPDSITLSSLGQRVADSIARFLQEHANTPTPEQGWNVNQYPLDRLYLLELRHVSEGSWQPVLSYVPL